MNDCSVSFSQCHTITHLTFDEKQRSRSETKCRYFSHPWERCSLDRRSGPALFEDNLHSLQYGMHTCIRAPRLTTSVSDYPVVVGSHRIHLFPPIKLETTVVEKLTCHLNTVQWPRSLSPIRLRWVQVQSHSAWLPLRTEVGAISGRWRVLPGVCSVLSYQTASHQIWTACKNQTPTHLKFWPSACSSLSTTWTF